MTSVPSGLNPAEVNALEVGTIMYRAAISQEMGQLLGGIGLDSVAVDSATAFVADHARNLTLLDAKSAAESIRLVRTLLVGSGATGATTQLGFVDQQEVTSAESVLADANFSDVDSDGGLSTVVAAETEHEAVAGTAELDLESVTEPEIEIPKVLIDAKAVKSLVHFFGEENIHLLEQIAADSSRALVNALVDIAAERKIIWRTQTDIRKHQFHAKLFEGLQWPSLGDEKASAQGTYSRTGIKMREILSTDERAAIIEQVLTTQTGTPEAPQEVNVNHDAPLEPIPETIEPVLPTDAETTRAQRIVKEFLVGIDSDELAQMTVDQAMDLVTKIMDEVATAKPRLAKTLPRRLEDIKEYIAGKTWTDISRSQNRTASYAQVSFQYLRTAYREIQSRKAATELKGVASSVTARQAETLQSGASQDDTSTESNESAGTRAPEVVENGNPFDKLARAVMQDETSARLIESLFDAERNQPSYNPEALSAYDDIAVCLDLIKSSRQYGAFAETLEFKAYEMMVRGARDGGPLPPKSVRENLGKELAAAQRKFREVVHTGADQIAAIRQQMRAA